MVLPPFEFVFGLPDLGLGELEVPLAMRLGEDVCGLGAALYMLSMNQKLPSIVVVSKRALCALKLMRRGIFLISSLILHRFPSASSKFTNGIGFYLLFCIVYYIVLRIMFGV